MPPVGRATVGTRVAELLVNIDVDDLERGVRFYVRGLGLKVGQRLGEDAVERAVSTGARLEDAVEERAWGRLARMADPFGHGFCILQFKGKGYREGDAALGG